MNLASTEAIDQRFAWRGSRADREVDPFLYDEPSRKGFTEPASQARAEMEAELRKRGLRETRWEGQGNIVEISDGGADAVHAALPGGLHARLFRVAGTRMVKTALHPMSGPRTPPASMIKPPQPRLARGFSLANKAIAEDPDSRLGYYFDRGLR
jgi:hypothetical protein